MPFYQDKGRTTIKYQCTKCKDEKTEDQMSRDKSRRNGISSWCKECRKDTARNWKSKYPEKAEKSRLKRIEDYKNAPPEYLQQRAYVLRLRYGMSLEDYDSLLEKQNYQCAVCKRDSREMTYLLHTDHCHTSGKVRGLLCAPCNVYLGYIKDNASILEAGKEYLLANQ